MSWRRQQLVGFFSSTSLSAMADRQGVSCLPTDWLPILGGPGRGIMGGLVTEGAEA